MHYILKLIPLFDLPSPESTTAPTITLETSTKDTEVILGRSEVTGITDKRCSREHAKLKIDSRSNEVVFSQLGSNPSSINYQGEEIILSKFDIKRLPLSTLSSKSQKCLLYLIHKDQHYGYKVKVKETEVEDEAKVTKPPQTQIHDSTTSKKRSMTSLDSFVVKRAKTIDESKKSDVDILKKGCWTECAPLVYLYHSEDVASSSKVAGFDMDGTLIATKSGAKWPKDKDDWKFIFASVPVKLRALHAEGFKLVIFTNQASVARGTVKAKDIQYKIEMIIQQIGVPMQAMIAGCRHGKFRKPSHGMWTHICERENDNMVVDKADCVYVGDAAGRPANWKPGKKKDFSNSDRLFAINADVRFATPEAYFNGEAEALHEMPEFDPHKAMKVKTLFEPLSAKLHSGAQEMIVMVGFPGSGKTNFSTKHLNSYDHINRDSLGSWQKCVARCDKQLSLGKSVVVDNTNPDQESRARYVEVAKKLKVPVRCFLMATTYKQSRHNEIYRQQTNSKHKPINDMIVNSYKSKYVEPSLSEGFTEVVKVNVVLKFDNEQQRELYSTYLLDK